MFELSLRYLCRGWFLLLQIRKKKVSDLAAGLLFVLHYHAGMTLNHVKNENCSRYVTE